MENEHKITLVRIIISSALLIITFAARLTGTAAAIVCISAYAIIGADILWKAVRNILKGEVFDECFLMSIATIGALIIGEFPEAAAVMIFYQAGEMFQDIAVEKSRRSIASLMDIRPDHANIEMNGELVQVSPESVEKGSMIIVKPGEKIPIDGIVIDGESCLNTSALTGESMPRDIIEGDKVISGCININGLIKIRTTDTFGESTVSKILKLVEEADSGKARTERFITRFAKIYTPAVVLGAVLMAVFPSLFTGDWISSISRALIFLVISCPCALVISVPLSFFAGIGGASRCGILIKGSDYLEALAKTEIMVFDKTGTLTKGNFTVTEIYSGVISKEKLLKIAALSESYSDHPAAKSIREAYGRAVDRSEVTDTEDISGHGIKAEISGQVIYAGNERLMKRAGVSFKTCNATGTVIHIASHEKYLGYIVISDEIKPQAETAIKELKSMGIRRTVMLTGDRKEAGESVAGMLGIDEVYTEMLPADKVERVKHLMEKKSDKGRLVFVGDGINDAPVLKCSDAGIAMGAIGSDAALEAADVVVMDDDPLKIAKAVKISRKTLRIVMGNIVFILVVKALFLAFSILGIATMWGAVFADVGVAVIAIINSLRAMKQ